MRQAQIRFLIARPPALLLASFAWLACIASPNVGSAQQPDSTILPLLSRPLAVSQSSTSAFWNALASASSHRLHGLVWLPRHPSSLDRESLRGVGVTILAPVYGTTYWALVNASADTSRSPIRPLRFAIMEPRDRVAPQIWNGQLGGYTVQPMGSKPVNYVENADSSLNLGVFFHEDIGVEQAEAILRNTSSSIKRLSDRIWTIVARRDQLRRLAAYDAVRWIDAALPPLVPDNDKTRAAIKVDALQLFDATTGKVGGLGGLNVLVGVFDFGIDESHDDFAGRVLVSIPLTNWHATHVAGVIAGDGKLSAGSDSWSKLNGGSAYQWRGMAPQAQLIDANANDAFFMDKMLGYVETTGMDISNHSYSYDFDGAYTWDAVADDLIAGRATYGGLPISARLHVYSTGNHGQQPFLGGEQIGYFSLTKQSKNGLMVGAYDPVLGQIEPNSSLGPAYDGRIKPDVVAPGANVWSTGYCETKLPAKDYDPALKCVNPPTGMTSRHDFYQAFSGSSDAAAAVTGMLALVLQQHAITYGSAHKPPLPSTLRAITVQTAHDISSPSVWFTNGDGPVQAFPGPDFVTGYGMVDAEAAVNVVKNRQYIEDVVPAICETRTWWIRIKGKQDLRVTLAWDDPAGNPALLTTAPKLVNDLDLELIEPVTNKKYYPWLLDQRVVDGAGGTVPNSAQSCGTPVTVERKVLPTATPMFVTPGDPSNINDPLPAGTIQPAGSGKDHLNNIEQVVVRYPRSGWWQARVTGFNITGPQSYSLTLPGRPALKTPLVSFCGVPACQNIFGNRICERIPELCDPLAIEVFPGHVPVTFRDMRDLVFLPLDRICLFLIDCPLCSAGGICRAYDVTFNDMPLPLTLDVYDKAGNRVFSDRTKQRTKRVSFPAHAGQDYLLVIGPVQGVRIGKQYNLPVKTTQR